MTKIQIIQSYLAEHYANAISHDIVSDKLMILPSSSSFPSQGKDGLGSLSREMTTRDINTIVCDCANACNKNISDRDVRCVLRSSFIPEVHPPRAYLQSLHEYRPVKGETPLDYLAAQVTVEGGPEAQQLWHDTFIRWFVAMVATWMYDEVVNQHVLVLIGEQGIFKTTWLEHLIPPCLRAYTTKIANVHDLNKDERLRVAESVLINIDEIDAMSDRELNQMKSLITTSDVNERAAYAYSKERRIRLASFCASGNKDRFLTDTTGNRRWLPFRVSSIQNPYLNPVQPYDMYYAQAVLQARQERTDPERLRYWTQRFQHQLRHPEPNAPIEPETGKHHTYKRLDLFIVATLLRN